MRLEKRRNLIPESLSFIYNLTTVFVYLFLSAGETMFTNRELRWPLFNLSIYDFIFTLNDVIGML